MWLTILKDITPDANGNPMEGPTFNKGPWSIHFRASATENVRMWAGKGVSGPQYKTDTQKLSNHLIGHLRGKLLAVMETYLNNRHMVMRALLHRVMSALLRKCMNTQQRRLMAREAKMKLPTLEYHNEKGRLGLQDHIAAMAELFAALNVAGAPPTKDEKVLHLTDSIMNKKLATRTVSHIIASMDTRPHQHTCSQHLPI